MSDEVTSERYDGPTPNGGTYSVVNFLDAERKPCPKDRAVYAELFEYDADDQEVGRAWLSFEGQETLEDLPDA